MAFALGDLPVVVGASVPIAVRAEGGIAAETQFMTRSVPHKRCAGVGRGVPADRHVVERRLRPWLDP